MAVVIRGKFPNRRKCYKKSGNFYYQDLELVNSNNNTAKRSSQQVTTEYPVNIHVSSESKNADESPIVANDNVIVLVPKIPFEHVSGPRYFNYNPSITAQNEGINCFINRNSGCKLAPESSKTIGVNSYLTTQLSENRNEPCTIASESWNTPPPGELQVDITSGEKTGSTNPGEHDILQTHAPRLGDNQPVSVPKEGEPLAMLDPSSDKMVMSNGEPCSLVPVKNLPTVMLPAGGVFNPPADRIVRVNGVQCMLNPVSSMSGGMDLETSGTTAQTASQGILAGRITLNNGQANNSPSSKLQSNLKISSVYSLKQHQSLENRGASRILSSETGNYLSLKNRGAGNLSSMGKESNLSFSTGCNSNLHSIVVDAAADSRASSGKSNLVLHSSSVSNTSPEVREKLLDDCGSPELKDQLLGFNDSSQQVTHNVSLSPTHSERPLEDMNVLDFIAGETINEEEDTFAGASRQDKNRSWVLCNAYGPFNASGTAGENNERSHASEHTQFSRGGTSSVHYARKTSEQVLLQPQDKNLQRTTNVIAHGDVFVHVGIVKEAVNKTNDKTQCSENLARVGILNAEGTSAGTRVMAHAKQTSKITVISSLRDRDDRKQAKSPGSTSLRERGSSAEDTYQNLAKTESRSTFETVGAMTADCLLHEREVVTATRRIESEVMPQTYFNCENSRSSRKTNNANLNTEAQNKSTEDHLFVYTGLLEEQAHMNEKNSAVLSSTSNPPYNTCNRNVVVPEVTEPEVITIDDAESEVITVDDNAENSYISKHIRQVKETSSTSKCTERTKQTKNVRSAAARQQNLEKLSNENSMSECSIDKTAVVNGDIPSGVNSANSSDAVNGEHPSRETDIVTRVARVSSQPEQSNGPRHSIELSKKHQSREKVVDTGMTRVSSQSEQSEGRRHSIEQSNEHQFREKDVDTGMTKVSGQPEPSRGQRHSKTSDDRLGHSKAKHNSETPMKKRKSWDQDLRSFAIVSPAQPPKVRETLSVAIVSHDAVTPVIASPAELQAVEPKVRQRKKDKKREDGGQNADKNNEDSGNEAGNKNESSSNVAAEENETCEREVINNNGLWWEVSRGQKEQDSTDVAADMILESFLNTMFGFLSKPNSLSGFNRARQLEAAVYTVNPVVSYCTANSASGTESTSSKHSAENFPCKCTVQISDVHPVTPESVTELLIHHQTCPGIGCKLCQYLRAQYIHIVFFHHRCEVWYAFTKLLRIHARQCKTMKCGVNFCRFTKHELLLSGVDVVESHKMNEQKKLIKAFSTCSKIGPHTVHLSCWGADKVH